MRVVALVEAAAGHRHDARLLVGQVDLIGRQRPFNRRRRRLAPGLLARRGGLGLARRHLGFMLRLLARVPLPGPRLDRRPRLGDLAQTLLAPRQFVGNRHAVGDIRLVRRLGLGQQIGDLGLQLRLDLARALVGKRAVPARVGVDLRPVQSDRAHLQHAHLARQLKNLDEQLLDLLQEPPPKRGDRVVVGMVVRRDEPERHRVVSRPLQLAARKYARRVTVNQQTQQHPGMIRSRTRASVNPAHPPQVETVDHFHDKPSQVPLRKPLVNRRRKQITRLPIDRPKIAHQNRPPPCANQRLILAQSQAQR